jgi:AraC family transcriptional regulator
MERPKISKKDQDGTRRSCCNSRIENMEIIQRMEQSLKFIEDHILDELTLDAVAAEACFSPYHFHRIFRAMVGEYIRKRRLTLAAEDLLSSSRGILDIALDYRFQSNEAFSRSFKKVYGFTPAAYRRNSVRLTTLHKKRPDGERLRHLREGVTMEPKIVRKEGFAAVGMEITTTLKSNGKNRDIFHLWGKFQGRMTEITNRVDDAVSYGICGTVTAELSKPAEMTEDTEYTELVCVEVTDLGHIPDGMIGRTIPGRTYAVFTHRGPLFPSFLQQTYDYIYGTWLPQSGKELDGGWDFEIYDRRFTAVDDPASELDIYVPVKAG